MVTDLPKKQCQKAREPNKSSHNYFYFAYNAHPHLLQLNHKINCHIDKMRPLHNCSERSKFSSRSAPVQLNSEQGDWCHRSTIRRRNKLCRDSQKRVRCKNIAIANQSRFVF